MRRLAVLAVLLAGCKRDPVWFGIWDLAEASRDGQRQADFGTLEIMRNGELAAFLRYRWSGGGWEPDPSPAVLFGTTSASTSDDVIDAYHQKDERYTLFLSPWANPESAEELRVEAYGPSFAVLVGDANPWPGDANLTSIELVLER